MAEIADRRTAEFVEAVELREVIRSLPVEAAEVVILHYLQGYDCREIAAIVVLLELPPNDILLAHQDDFHAQIPGGSDRSLDFRRGSVV